MKVLKFLVAFFTFYFLLFTLPASVHAQAPVPAYVSPTSPIYTDLLVHNLFHTFSCLTIGSSVIGQPCLTYKIQKNAQGAIQSIPVLSSVNLSGGALGATTSLINALYANPPVRTVDYLASLGQGFGIIKEAKAQGVIGSGEGILHPILTLWQVSRNLAYLFMIIIFVVIGLMVMFRNKLNPQTIITAQAALPGLVIGLILITFSYFAAALITDTAFIGVNLVGYYFSSAIDPITAPAKPSLLQQLQAENVISIGSSFAGKLGIDEVSKTADIILNNLDKDGNLGGATSPQNMVKLMIGLAAYKIGSSIGAALGGLASAGFLAYGAAAAAAAAATAIAAGIAIGPVAIPAAVAAPIIAAAAGPIVGTIFSAAAYTAPTMALGIALALAALLAVLYAVFKLFLALLNNYLSIIFLTVTAPFHFLAASLPGRQEIAVSWIRNMLANILAFPAVIVVFYFAAYLLGDNQIKAFGISQQLGIPGKTETLPLFGGLDLSFIRMLLAFGAILATPKIPEIISRSIGKPGASGQLIGQAIDEATRSGQQYAGQNQQNFGGATSNIRDSWRTWKGQDPWYSGAKKYQELGGKVPKGFWGGFFKPQEITNLNAPPTGTGTGAPPHP